MVWKDTMEVRNLVKLLDWVADPPSLGAEEAARLLRESGAQHAKALLERVDLNKAPQRMMAGLAHRMGDDTFSNRVLAHVESGGEAAPVKPLFTAASSLLLMDPTESNLYDWAEVLVSDPNETLYYLTLDGLHQLYCDRYTPNKSRPPFFSISVETEEMLLRAIPTSRRVRQIEGSPLDRVMRMWPLQGASETHHKQWTRILGGANTKVPPQILFDLLGLPSDKTAMGRAMAPDKRWHIPTWSYFKWTVEHWGRHQEVTAGILKDIPSRDQEKKVHPQYATEYGNMLDVMTVLPQS